MSVIEKYVISSGNTYNRLQQILNKTFYYTKALKHTKITDTQKTIWFIRISHSKQLLENIKAVHFYRHPVQIATKSVIDVRPTGSNMYATVTIEANTACCIQHISVLTVLELPRKCGAASYWLLSNLASQSVPSVVQFRL